MEIKYKRITVLYTRTTQTSRSKVMIACKEHKGPSYCGYITKDFKSVNITTFSIGLVRWEIKPFHKSNQTLRSKSIRLETLHLWK